MLTSQKERVNGIWHHHCWYNPCYVCRVNLYSRNRKFNGGLTLSVPLSSTVSVISYSGFTRCSAITQSNSKPVSLRHITTWSFYVIFSTTRGRIHSGWGPFCFRLQLFSGARHAVWSGGLFPFTVRSVMVDHLTMKTVSFPSPLSSFQLYSGLVEHFLVLVCEVYSESFFGLRFLMKHWTF